MSITLLTINFGVQFITLVINKCVKKPGIYISIDNSLIKLKELDIITVLPVCSGRDR